jgi:hypothetical protein
VKNKYLKLNIMNMKTFETLIFICLVTLSFNIKAQKSVLICDCESGQKTNLGSMWYSFTDENVKGASVVTPHTEGGQLFKTTAGGAAGTANSAMITYKLDKGAWKHSPFVGFGFFLSRNKKPLNLGKTTGVEFWHKGAAVNFSVRLQRESKVVQYNDHAFKVSAHKEWTKVTIRWDQLKQPKWGEQFPWDGTKVTQFIWRVNGTTGEAGKVYIDEVTVFER